MVACRIEVSGSIDATPRTTSNASFGIAALHIRAGGCELAHRPDRSLTAPRGQWRLGSPGSVAGRGPALSWSRTGAPRVNRSATHVVVDGALGQLATATAYGVRRRPS